MKRQARLLLFFEREAQIINQILTDYLGYAGLYFSIHSFPALKNIKLKFLFKAASSAIPNTDAVFDTEKLPLPNDFFDVIVLDHLLDGPLAFDLLLKESTRILRKEGVILITGFNKTRLCSWPIQNAFGKDLSCPIRRYSTLPLLAQLEHLGFVTEIRYYDFCRASWCNKILAKLLPFLGMGFVIIAKRRTIPLMPLEELNLNFTSIKASPMTVQPEYFDPGIKSK